jgi:geranylgeranyl pyrophosphate synthase
MEKIMKITKFAVPYIIIIISSYASALIGSRVSDMQTEKQRAEIIKQNGEIIESLSGVAMSQSYVTDLLVRVSHYTDNHIKGNHLCMECEGTEFQFDDVEDVDVEVQETHKQVMADLREIETSIDSLTFGNLQQIKKLENMLKVQRSKITSEDLKEVWYGGVDCD